MITPQQEAPELAKALGLATPLYLKREDLHPYGSHKGRSIPYMIESYAQGGQRKFAISSSGNAALAALLYVQEYNKKFTEGPLSLQIFVGENIESGKYQVLKAQSSTNPQITITQTDKPRQTVHVLNKKGEAKALRQSNDPLALIGYESLVNELLEIEGVSAVFVPTSSATTAEALASKLPVEIVQTSSCHPIARQFDTDFVETESSLADAIVDRVALREQAVVSSVKSGWVISDSEISAAQGLVRDTCKLEVSHNAALSIAGLTKALKNGRQYLGPVVCLITGR